MLTGTELRQERERRGVELASIADTTRISRSHLEALEANNLTALPGGVFNRNILHNYCQCLGLDEAPWLEWIAGSTAGADEHWAEFAEAVKRNRSSAPAGHGLRWLGVVGIFLALAALAWGMWTFYLRERLHPRTTPAVTKPVSPVG